MTCRLFPAACPGPVPSPPPPLLGPPETEAEAAPPVRRAAKHHTRARKHTAVPADQ